MKHTNKTGRWVSFEETKAEILKDPLVRFEYEALHIESALIQTFIETRIKQGLTQKQLAAKVGLKQSALSRIETGQTNPTLATLGRVAVALGKKVTIT